MAKREEGSIGKPDESKLERPNFWMVRISPIVETRISPEPALSVNAKIPRFARNDRSERIGMTEAKASE
jgi:hypothetical protein